MAPLGGNESPNVTYSRPNGVLQFSFESARSGKTEKVEAKNDL